MPSRKRQGGREHGPREKKERIGQHFRPLTKKTNLKGGQKKGLQKFTKRLL